jgi:hypothetical protein
MWTRMRTIVTAAAFAACVTAPQVAAAQIRVNPDGVNVNSQAATTVFLTFGGVGTKMPAESVWCGALVQATPDIGMRCDPATIFGTLPAQFNQSRPSGTSGFTDIMSIPASVARRAYQAAVAGETSSFFYVRRFAGANGARDEYVAVTCRMAGGGARVPLSLLDVQLRFAEDVPVMFVRPGEPMSRAIAQITYNGTGRLKGRWEVALPGDEPPTANDLLTEASLPVEQRGQQRRYKVIDRFNEFLPPSGTLTLSGPDPAKLPTSADGSYLLLLRVEASDDKEADSNLGTAGAGTGIVHSGAVAGFPMPTLRYVVGASASDARQLGALDAVTPSEDAAINAAAPIDLVWVGFGPATLYRVEIVSETNAVLASAFVQAGTTTYRVPPFALAKAAAPRARWRVIALGADGAPIKTGTWHRFHWTSK